MKDILARLPERPGSYQFYDKSGTIIYVGKAKNLRARVSSYFHREVDSRKTRQLVEKVSDISYTVVNSETDALILENALIKKYKPHYNILLKDGKTYPSICISRETLPRIFKTRRINRKKGEYFGPYSHLPTMYALLELINGLFHPRSCNMPMTREGISTGRYRQCLEYHMGNCKAPCVGRQSVEEYMDNIAQARNILRGHTHMVIRHYTEEMARASNELRFEAAEEMKRKLMLLESFVVRSEVVSHTTHDIDVFAIILDSSERNFFINYMHVVEGMVSESFTFEYRRKMDENPEEVLLSAVVEIRERFHSDAPEVVVPFPMGWQLPEGARFVVPQKGDKRHLLELSSLNARQYAFDRLKQAEKLNPEQRQTRLMKELQKMLNLPHLPYHIECFDNSNISGQDAVAACVVFKAMRPSKKDYRKFHIRTVQGPDDYASMHEVVFRRYRRMMDEGAALPNLIITDGGVGQMNIVRQVVEDELHLSIPIAGLAKNARHRTNELLFGFPPQVVSLPTKSDLFRFLTSLQDEVHRFAITFHREVRSSRALSSELDDIPGVGPKTKDLLLRELRSLKRIREADMARLVQVVGQKKGQIIYDYFHHKEKGDET